MTNGARVELVPLLRCPFDGGPAILMLEVKGLAIAEDDPEVISEAWVWCHECGATGPRADCYASDSEAVVRVMREAAEAWNKPARPAENGDGGHAP